LRVLPRRSVLAGLAGGAAGLVVAATEHPGSAIAAHRATSAATPATGPTPALSIGLIPGEDVESELRLYQPLLDHIETSLEIEELEVFIGPDYTAVIEAMRAARLDVARFGPFSYVLARAVAEVEPIAVIGTDAGEPATYHSVILTAADSGIADLDDLRGRTIAFTDPASTSGYLFPRFMLNEAGIDPDQEMEPIFAGSGDAVLLAVANGQVDAGANSDLGIEVAIREGVIDSEQIAIIARSAPIPRSPFATRADLDPALRRRLLGALLSFHEENSGAAVEALLEEEGGTRYVEATDALYDPVRVVAQVLDLDLESLG